MYKYLTMPWWPKYWPKNPQKYLQFSAWAGKFKRSPHVNFDILWTAILECQRVQCDSLNKKKWGNVWSSEFVTEFMKSGGKL